MPKGSNGSKSNSKFKNAKMSHQDIKQQDQLILEENDTIAPVPVVVQSEAVPEETRRVT